MVDEGTGLPREGLYPAIKFKLGDEEVDKGGVEDVELQVIGTVGSS